MTKQPWLRLYRASLHSPKIVTLSDRQHRAWHNCLLMADNDGKLPSMRDIAVHMRMTATDAEQLICELVEAGLVDPVMVGTVRSYQMHDWNDHQQPSDNSAARVKKHRESKRNGDVTAVKRSNHAIEPEPDLESDTELEPEPDLSEKTVFEFDVSQVRIGLGEPSVSVEAKREICAELKLLSADLLAERFIDYVSRKGSVAGKVGTYDARFKGWARTHYEKNMTAADKARITIPPEPPPAIARPSSSLVSSLKGGRYGSN